MPDCRNDARFQAQIAAGTGYATIAPRPMAPPPSGDAPSVAEQGTVVG